MNRRERRTLLIFWLTVALLLLAAFATEAEYRSPGLHKRHDGRRGGNYHLPAGVHMIFSRFLVSGSVHAPSYDPTPRIGPETLSDRRSLPFFRWSDSLARPDRQARPGQGPFDRLRFWTVRHHLTVRLAPYQASRTPSLFRDATWATLLYWQELLD